MPNVYTDSSDYTISDDKRSAFKNDDSEGTLLSSPGVSEGTFTAYFKLNFTGEGHWCRYYGHGIGLMDEREAFCHPWNGGFVVNSDTGEVRLNSEFKGAEYRKRNSH